jgi:hypothetical protein
MYVNGKMRPVEIRNSDCYIRNGGRRYKGE